MPEQTPKPPSIECKFDDTSNAIDLYVYDLIVYAPKWSETETTAADVANELASHPDAATINVYINSAGGAVFEAFAIYNALVRHQATVNVFIDGLAASAASLLAMAGDNISMAENALLMIHEPSSFVWGNAEDMEKEVELLGKITNTLVTTYSARSGQPEDVVREWVEAETWFTSAEALDAKLIDQTTPAKRVAAHFDLSRFTNLPASLSNQRPSQPHNLNPSTPESFKMSDTPSPNSNLSPLDAALATLSDEHRLVVNAAITPADASAAPATHAQIKEACPGCDSAFIIDQLDAEATIDTARTAHLDTLVAKVENRDAEIARLNDELTATKSTIAEIKAGVGDDDAPATVDPTASKSGKPFNSFVRLSGQPTNN